VNVSCALDPRSVSPLWCLSAYRSWAAKTSSSSTRALRSTALTTEMCSCQSIYYPWCARYQGNFLSSTGQRSTPARDTMRHLEQRRRSFHRIFGKRTALTLMRLITGSGASSNSQCTSCGCTTLTNWNSVQQVWCNVDQSIIDMQSTSGASVFVHACRQTADTWELML